jgi:hypothetical protein
MISHLVEVNNKVALKQLSQQVINNATYLLRFGMHNLAGIHGATPLEMLHALLLGIFLYIRDMFFEQVGDTSQLAEELDALCIEYGWLFSRQSDRDMPKTYFTGGIRRGKLMAKEYTGIVLVLAAVLQSSHGRKLLTGANSRGRFHADFGQYGHLQDWILLVETLLQWEAWLKSDVMRRHHVDRAEKKHRYIMYLIKKIGRRSKGMGLKITKFHCIVHMARDMLNFGVPMNYDTGACEAGHKPVKVAAKLTQKKEQVFYEQVANRLMESFLLDLAMEEINGRKLWNYWEGHPPIRAKERAPSEGNSRIGGTRFEVVIDPDTGEYDMKLLTKIKGSADMFVEQDFINFVGKLQTKIADKYGINKVPIYGNHHREGMTFRGSPMNNGGVWRDWVMVDWSDDGELPCKIWGFVDLLDLPVDNNIGYGGYDCIPPGIYSIVESSQFAPLPENGEPHRSELFVPIRKEVRQIRNNRVTKLKFYLADVEAFVAPLVVVPDIGGEPNAYFLCKSRELWRKDFEEWLDSPHCNDEILLDESDEDSDNDNEIMDENDDISDELGSDSGQ